MPESWRTVPIGGAAGWVGEAPIRQFGYRGALSFRIANGDIGAVRRVTTAFNFKAPDKAWLEGGNGRTDKTREPMGCFGDQGWYPVGAILWLYNYALPERVQMTYVSKNTVDTIVHCGGTLWFSEGRMATFDCGCELPHRS